MVWIGRHIILCVCAAASCFAVADDVQPEIDIDALQQQRCGWFDNPSPQNASLLDREGEWLISQSGGRSASGKWPSREGSSQWVRTGVGSYGYGCVCAVVLVNPKPKQITHIVSSEIQPLSVCRRDRHLRGKEPFRSLKPLK